MSTTTDIAGTITVEIRSNYGVEAIYPTCEAGKLMLQLTGRKTLTRADLDVLKRLGYAIVVKQPVVKL